MGLNFRFLVNFGLLALPIAVTLGVLLGLQKHRDDTGQPPLFSPPAPPPGSPGGKPPKNNGFTSALYCQQFFGITPDTKGQEYTLNPNQWGWKEGDPGNLCMNVTTFNNNTYPSNTMAPEFSVSWQYPQGPETAPVHAFPNIKVDGSVFPASLDTISAINIDLEWSYGVGNETATTTDASQLTAHQVNANVAIDMFLDADQTQATDSTKAKYEVMVWFADFGPATQPIGLAQGAVVTKVLDGTTFSLYTGQNSLQQNVLTWVASEPTEKFTGDISSLITDLVAMGKTNFPSKSDYLGYLGMGSEAYSSDTVVTFYVPKLSIDIEKTA